MRGLRFTPHTNGENDLIKEDNFHVPVRLEHAIDPSRCPSRCGRKRQPGFRHCHFHVKLAMSTLRHPTKQHWQDQLKFLKQFAKGSPDRVWIFDCEFTQFECACPTAWEGCFRNLQGDILFTWTFDYGNSTVDKLLEEYNKLRPDNTKIHPVTERR